jgi:general secretion pathway protein H
VGSVISPVSITFARVTARRRARGFTLLELLVVLVIAGLTLGLISLNAMPNNYQALQNDAQRIALLLQTARDEAILRNRPIMFESDGISYRFLIRNENKWEPMPQDDLLRERDFKRAPVSLLLTPPQPDPSSQLRIVFGREPVDQPFLLTMSAGGDQVKIRANGIGLYEVE